MIEEELQKKDELVDEDSSNRPEAIEGVKYCSEEDRQKMFEKSKYGFLIAIVVLTVIPLLLFGSCLLNAMY